MGNCNTRLLFMGTMNGNTRTMHAAAPASEDMYESNPGNLLRSTSSEDSTFILFHNQTESPVKLYWLNYEGQEVPYRSIEPGRVHRQQTFVTHPWTFKINDPSDEEKEEDVVVEHRRVVFPSTENRNAVLRKPSTWEWSPENHVKRFPKKFVESTQSFLFTHHSLRFGSAALHKEASERGQADLGILPTEIVLRIIELSAPPVPYLLPPPSQP